MNASLQRAQTALDARRASRGISLDGRVNAGLKRHEALQLAYVRSGSTHYLLIRYCPRCQRNRRGSGARGAGRDAERAGAGHPAVEDVAVGVLESTTGGQPAPVSPQNQLETDKGSKSCNASFQI